MSRYVDIDLITRELNENGFFELEKIPTVDAIPVVHAHPERVIEKQGYFRKHFREYCCSVCKHEIRSWYRYCCYCGARLDEVTE